MAAIQEVRPDISMNTAFRWLFFHVDDVFDKAEQNQAITGNSGNSRQIKGTNLILQTNIYAGDGMQHYSKTLNVVEPRGKMLPLIKVVIANPLSGRLLTIDDATPHIVNFYPQTEAQLNASVSRRPGMPDDEIAVRIANDARGPKLSLEKTIRGFGVSRVDGSVQVGELPEDSTERFNLINTGLRIAADGIVSLIDGQPTPKILEELQAAHTELFLV